MNALCASNNSQDGCYLTWLPLRESEPGSDFFAPFCDNISMVMVPMDLMLPLIVMGAMFMTFFVTIMTFLVTHNSAYTCACFQRVFTHSFVINICIQVSLLLVYLILVLGVFFSYHFCVDMTYVIHWVLYKLWPLSKEPHPPMKLTLLLLLVTTTTVWCSDADSSTAGVPMFKATKVHYPIWFMAWCGWVALKFPELIDVLQGDEEEPEIDDEDDEDQVRANTDWWKKNKRLYGAVLQAVPTSLKTTLGACRVIKPPPEHLSLV